MRPRMVIFCLLVMFVILERETEGMSDKKTQKAEKKAEKKEEKMERMTMMKSGNASMEKPTKHYFQYSNCSEAGGHINVSTINILPDPVRVDGNISVTLDAEVLWDIPQDAMLKIHISKKVAGALPITIPCLGSIGSCTKPLCYYLDTFTNITAPFYPDDRETGCPLRAGRYTGHNVTLTFPDVGPLIKLFAKGKFKAKLELISNDETLFCLKVQIKLK